MRDSKPKIEVIPAGPGEGPILANLLELYAHDFSEFHDLDLGPDGRFRYRSLPLYWSEPDRHALLASIDGKLAGFVLVKGVRKPLAMKLRGTWPSSLFFVRTAARNWNSNGARSVEAVSGNVGSSGDAVECLGRPFLGVCHLHIYRKGDRSCLRRERWRALETFLI